MIYLESIFYTASFGLIGVVLFIYGTLILNLYTRMNEINDKFSNINGKLERIDERTKTLSDMKTNLDKMVGYLDAQRED